MAVYRQRKSDAKTLERARRYMQARRAAGRCMRCPAQSGGAYYCPACTVRVKKERAAK